jgi:lysophospholipase L1-like esterase
MRLWVVWVAAFAALFCSSGEWKKVAAQEQPQWIWDQAEAKEKATQDPLLFRRAFGLQGKIDSAGLWVTADNRYEVVVNGVLVGQGENWQVPQKFILKGLLLEGDNEVIIRAKNDDDGPGALAAWLTYSTPQGETTLATNRFWQQRKDDSDANDLWWAARDDAGWKPAVELGAIKTTEPWGNQVAWDQPQEVVIARSIRPRQESFEFLDGDRVTWIGGTWVERQQAFNYLEGLVTAAYPDRDIRFRNLGWSGDDVTGIARAVFGSQEDGFKRLRDDLLRTAPNVILVGYGANEAFRGEEGLQAFEQGWNRLTRLLESTGATIVVIGPHYLENLGAPLPDPSKVNREVDRYTETLKKWSADRGYHFVDFRSPLENEPQNSKFVPIIRDRLTDNGIHFNDYGYWRTAPKLAEQLNVPWNPWSVELSLGDTSRVVSGGRFQAFEVKPGRVQFTIQDDHLPYASAPVSSPRGGELSAVSGRFVIKNLPEGKYGLNINGQPTVMATHEQWANGITLDRSKAVYQFEDLKNAIGKKNELYFHRYRPQNETYLFLFRKHEQGNNAVEVPQFDGLVAEQEEVIRQLREPKPVTYELILIQQGDE